MPSLQVKCPTCRRSMEWSSTSSHRPFCSERCKLIDLGAWLTERHAIPGEPADKTEDGGQMEGENGRAPEDL